mgnify:CR=1 FL=1
MSYCKYTQEEIIDFYTADHTHPTKCVMWGQAVWQKRNEVKNFVLSTRPESILDYGSGKGFQYSEHKIHEDWTQGNYISPRPVCYDPGVPEFSEKPAKKCFPDGTNYHVLCRPEEWWFANIKRLKPKDLTVWLFFWSMKGVIILNAEK